MNILRSYVRRKALAHLQSALFYAVFLSITAAMFYLAANYASESDGQFQTMRLIMFAILYPLLVKLSIQLCAALLYSPIEKLRYRQRNDRRLPRVSVIVPAWNEEVGIIKTMESVVRARYANFELVVVNDGSTDRTHELVTEYIKQHRASKKTGGHPPIKYLNLPNGGKATAMNRALEVVDGEIMITIDADSVMDPYAIRQFVDSFTDEKVAGVAGNVIVANRNKPLELLQQLEYLYGFFFKRADSVFNSVYIIGGAAAAYRTSVIKELGGFDEAIITEDIELSVRLLNAGYKTRYAAKSVIYTEGPSEWTGLCKQRLRWKFGRLQTFIKHKNLFFSPDKKHPMYFSWLIFPLALYAELLLLFEFVLVGLFLTYTIMTFDYLPFVFVILFLTSLVSVQIALDSKARFHLNLLLLAPIAWILFYVVDVIEFQALVRSLKRMVKKQSLTWQKWSRAGIISNSLR